MQGTIQVPNGLAVCAMQLLFNFPQSIGNS